MTNWHFSTVECMLMAKHGYSLCCQYTCIWMLVGLMILVSHFPQRFAVSVFATLILLSQYAMIAVSNIAYLEYPHHSKGVWLFDATSAISVPKTFHCFRRQCLSCSSSSLSYTLFLLLASGCRPYHTWGSCHRSTQYCSETFVKQHHYRPGQLLLLFAFAP